MQIHTNITDATPITVFGYLSGFWDFSYNRGFTANAPLWFMRDLMVVSLCAPLLRYILQRKWWIISLPLMALAHIANIEIPISGFNVEAFFYFSIGATLAIHRADATRIPHTIGVICLFLYIPVSYFLLGLYEQLWYISASIIAIFIRPQPPFTPWHNSSEEGCCLPHLYLPKIVSFYLHSTVSSSDPS